MSHYPTDETWNEKGLECPGCGHVHEDVEGELYPQHSLENDFEGHECENCSLIFDGHVELRPTWTATHPQKCDIKGYHIVTDRKGKHGCPYCEVELTCDCEVWNYDKATEDNKLHGIRADVYIPLSDRRGHCKHQIKEVATNA